MAEMRTLTIGDTTYEIVDEKARNSISAMKDDTLSLGIASDGLIYLFVNGSPIGTGIPQGQSGDVFGYVDENNTIVLTGALPDGAYNVKYEMADGSNVPIGNLVLDTNVYYSITKNLAYCTINNSATQAIKGNSYTATITANDGYELKSVTVTMGGSAVSVTNGVINIASVTGNIVITAVAEEEVQETNYFVNSPDNINKRLSSTGTSSAYNGMVVTDFIPVDSSMFGKIFKVSGVTLVKSTAYSYCVRYVYFNAEKTKVKEFNNQNVNSSTYDIPAWNDSISGITEGYLRISLVIKDNVALTEADVVNLKITLE